MANGCDIYKEKMTNNTAYVNGDMIGVYREVDLGNLIVEKTSLKKIQYGKLFCCH